MTDAPTWATALLEVLRGRSSRRVPIDLAIAALIEVRPDLATSSERFRLLSGALDELAAVGAVTPTTTRVRRGDVALPTSFVLEDAQPRSFTPNRATSHPWVADLRWVAGVTRLPEPTLERLIRLNRWLANNRNRSIAPVRERSLEIFDDDKVLEKLLRRGGVLAAPGRLPAELRVEIVHPPMAVERIPGSSGRGLLVVENGTTFRSVVRAAQFHAAAGPIDLGWVGYGSGEQLTAILPSVAGLNPPPVFIGYFGDLDPKGLTIAAAGAAVELDGLPSLAPNRLLYRWLLGHGRPQRNTKRGAWPEPGLGWLGPELSDELHRRLADDGWLAQEWVNIDLLLASRDWTSRSCLAPVAIPSPG